MLKINDNKKRLNKRFIIILFRMDIGWLDFIYIYKWLFGIKWIKYYICMELVIKI